MSLDFYLEYKVDNNDIEVFSRNITHNLGEMADKAGIYEALWRPHRLSKDWDKGLLEKHHMQEYKFEDEHIVHAHEIVEKLEVGLKDLKNRPGYFKTFNSENGWGMYKHFVPFVEEVLEACKQYPNAIITSSR